MGETAYGIGEGPATLVSLSLPEGTVEAIRTRVGMRGFAAFVAEVVERELLDEQRARQAFDEERVDRRRLLREELDRYQGESGAFSDQEIAEAQALLMPEG